MGIPIRFAVLGAGHIGKRHCSVIKNNNLAELVAIIDSNQDLEYNLIEQFHVPFYNSLEDFLNSSLAVDVINICTPNGLHAIQSIQCLESGYHVVCEKPMSLSKKDSSAMIEATKKHKKEIFCVMQNRYSPISVWLKELISEHKLGDINLVVVNCFWNRDNRYYNSSDWRGKKLLDGGTLFTQFSHYVDTIYWLFGDITNISSRIMNFNHGTSIEFEDSGIATFDFINGGSCSFNFATTSWEKNFVSSIHIVGSKGCVCVAGQYMNEVQYCHIQDYIMPELSPILPANDYGFYKGSAANHEYVIQNVIDHLLHQTPITASPEEGEKVVEIIEKIYASSNK
ncbi:MAG: gfo/Idh/MocA family oxidoreductase [Cytophagales bacterium]|nr:MAG: gfo/Idh/MocA family oxidoreductase [Cytophagales bacterium]